MDITIEWIEDNAGYDVRQNGEFIGDFFDLVSAAAYALAVSENTGGNVIIIGVEGS